jgi:peptidoglycan/LPS O-acetylase OafA/YrhL
MSAATLHEPSIQTASRNGARYDAYRSRPSFGSLDGLRGLSIAAVVWHHTQPERGGLGDYLRGAHLGFLGVDLFFILSGFLIVTLLLRERERQGEISLRSFYVRRALRIFPLYYGVLAAFTLLYALRSDPRAEAFREDLPYLALYLSNWVAVSGSLSIAWSLAAEEQFYAVWPPVERFLRRQALPLLLAIIALSELIQLGALDAALARVFGWGPDEPSMLREATFAPICFGVLLAHALHRRSSFERIVAIWGHGLAAPLALVGFLLVAQWFPSDVRGWARPVAHLFMLSLLASVVVREDHGLARLLTWRPLARLGVVSYGVYLLHGIAITFAERGVGSVLGPSLWNLPLVPFLLGGLCAFGAAELSFRFYERPFLELKRRWGSASPESAAGAERRNS